MLLFDIIRTGLTEMSQLRLQTVRSSVDIEWGDPTKKGTGSTTGHEHVLLSILAINARYSVYLTTVFVQFPPWERKRKEKKKRKAVNLDAKSLLNGSWQTMGDVNLFILLRMYRASCIILPPRVLRRLRFIIFYWNFTLRFRSNFSRASFLYLSIFQISRAWEISNSTCKSYLFDSFVSYSFQYSPLFTIVRSELP